MSIKRIAVIGAGTMGRGIVETAAVHALEVHVAEIDPEQRRMAETQIETSIAKAIQRGRLDLPEPGEDLSLSVGEALGSPTRHRASRRARTADSSSAG